MEERRETEHTGESPSPGHRDQGQVDVDVLKQRDTTTTEETTTKREKAGEKSSSSKN